MRRMSLGVILRKTGFGSIRQSLFCLSSLTQSRFLQATSISWKDMSGSTEKAAQQLEEFAESKKVRNGVC